MALGSLPIMGADVALIFPWLVALAVVAAAVSFYRAARVSYLLGLQHHPLGSLSAAFLLHHSDLGVAAEIVVVKAATIAILAAVVVALVALGAALREKEAFPVALNPSLWK